MKKLFLSALAVFAVYNVVAQGTVQFQNSVLSPITTNSAGTGRANANMNLTASLYWGTTADTVYNLAGVEYINPASPGVLLGNILFAINGAAPQSTVFLEIRVNDPAFTWFGTSGVLPFQLGAPQGPATILFGSANTPNVFHGFDVAPVPGPEPSTMALAGVGAACLFCFWRRKSVK